MAHSRFIRLHDSNKETTIWQRVLLHGSIVLSAALISASLACSRVALHSSTRTSYASWCAGLDECREVELSCDLLRDRMSTESVHEYEQLRLVIRPRKHLRFQRRLKTIEIKPGVARGQVQFRNVEARAGESLQKVWFVDRESARVIATLDRETGETTGPDDIPPAWATPDSGVPLALSDQANGDEQCLKARM